MNTFEEPNMQAFPYSDALDAGRETRKLATHARELLAEAETSLKVIPINAAARSALHDSAILDRRLAIKSIREARQIVKPMRRHPGFLEGWGAAA